MHASDAVVNGDGLALGTNLLSRPLSSHLVLFPGFHLATLLCCFTPHSDFLLPAFRAPGFWYNQTILRYGFENDKVQGGCRPRRARLHEQGRHHHQGRQSHRASRKRRHQTARLPGDFCSRLPCRLMPDPSCTARSKILRLIVSIVLDRMLRATQAGRCLGQVRRGERRRRE